MTISNYIGTDCNFKELKLISIDSFFKKFGKMSPEEARKFIGDTKNEYDIGLFIHRTLGRDKIPAYNGMSYRNTIAIRAGSEDFSKLGCRNKNTVSSKYVTF